MLASVCRLCYFKEVRKFWSKEYQVWSFYRGFLSASMKPLLIILGISRWNYDQIFSFKQNIYHKISNLAFWSALKNDKRSMHGTKKLLAKPTLHTKPYSKISPYQTSLIIKNFYAFEPRFFGPLQPKCSSNKKL